jgi:hypothetical protein
MLANISILNSALGTTTDGQLLGDLEAAGGHFAGSALAAALLAGDTGTAAGNVQAIRDALEGAKDAFDGITPPAAKTALDASQMAQHFNVSRDAMGNLVIETEQWDKPLSRAGESARNLAGSFAAAPPAVRAVTDEVGVLAQKITQNLGDAGDKGGALFLAGFQAALDAGADAVQAFWDRINANTAAGAGQFADIVYRNFADKLRQLLDDQAARS